MKKNKTTKKAKKRIDEQKRIEICEKWYQLFLTLAVVALFAFSFCAGLGANFYATLAVGIIAALFFITAAVFGFFSRFKKNWDKDKNSTASYFEGTDVHDEEINETKENKKDED